MEKHISLLTFAVSVIMLSASCKMTLPLRKHIADDLQTLNSYIAGASAGVYPY